MKEQRTVHFAKRDGVEARLNAEVDAAGLREELLLMADSAVSPHFHSGEPSIKDLRGNRAYLARLIETYQELGQKDALQSVRYAEQNAAEYQKQKAEAVKELAVIESRLAAPLSTEERWIETEH
jgi:hypothetical protein